MVERDIALFERPLLNFARSTQVRMIILAACLAAVVLQSALSDGFFSLVIALCAIAGTVAAELLVSALRRQRLVNDFSAVASALVLSVMLPNTLNPAFVFIGAFFAVAVAKGSYGGLGSNWLNPALAGWLFIRFSWPDFFMLSIKDSRLSASGTIGVLSAPDDFLGRALFNGIESLNQTIFQTFSCEIPSGFASFCVNTGTGIIADRGVLALIAASLVICASMQKFILPAVYLAVYLTLARLAGFVPGSHGEMGDVFYCLFSGGTILTAFVLAADPATSPKSPVGKMGMAVFAALLSFVFRYICAELYGAFFTVAALNVLCAALRAEESKRIYNRVKGGAGEAYIWN